MRMSEKGLKLLKKHEGLRLRAYDDLQPGRTLHPGDPVIGTVTIGYGHIKTAVPGMEITEAEALELLKEDLLRFENGVHDLTDHMALEQHEFDALVSFAFNVGLGALEQSTLLRYLLEDNKRDAADEFRRWVFSKGRKLAGLERRRLDERDLFLGRAVAA